MLKNVVLTAGALLVILLIAAVITPFFIPAGKFRGVITEYAEAAIGHPVKIEGAIRFKAFPFVGVYMENISVGEAPEKNKPLFAHLESINVEIDTLAALTGNIIVKSLSIDKPQINLLVDTNGKANWESNHAVSTKATPVRNSSSATDISESVFAIENLALEDVGLEQGYINYQNLQNKEAISLKNITLNVSLKGLDKPFNVKGNAEYNNADIVLKGTIESLRSYLTKKVITMFLQVESALIKMEAKGTLDNTVYRGSIAFSSPSLIKTTEWLTKKPSAANFVSSLPLTLSSNAVCSVDACQFRGAKLKLDTIEANGDVQTKFSGVVPYVDLKLTTNEIDFNIFKAKELAASASIISSAHAATPGWRDEQMDFSVLRNIELLANIDAAGIRMNNIKIGNTTLRAKIQRARLSMDIIDAVFYGGKANITANIDASGKTLAADKRINFSGIQMESLLKDAEMSDRYSGIANIQANVVTNGNTERQMISNLQGAGSVKVNDGSIKGINIAQMVRNVQSAFKQVDTSGQKTDFTEAGGTFSIAKGVVLNKDLAMKAPLFRIKGEGQVDLPARTVNYRLIPEIVETIQGQGGKEKEGFAVPVIIQGSIDNPTYRPDLESTIREAIKDPEKIKETLKDVKEQIKENKGDLKNILKDKKGLQNLLKKL